MLLKLNRISARPLTRPGRCTLVMRPFTYVPAGITTALSMVTGKVLWQYTPSPTRALLVSIGLFSCSRTCVPAGTVICRAPLVGFGLDWLSSGFDVCAANVRLVAIRKTIKLRIVSPLEGTQAMAMLTQSEGF